MNSWNTAPRHTVDQIARLHNDARERALALRAEAMDKFWRDVGDVVVASSRAAVRLAHRLQRHAGPRAEAAPAGTRCTSAADA